MVQAKRRRYPPVVPGKSPRRPAAPEKPGRRSVWTFLNSPLGLWLLSTLFISVGSWLYTRWTESRAEEKQRQERVERLDLEIESRLDNGGKLMVIMGSIGGEPIPVADLPAKVLLAPQPGFEIFPEFANRNLRSLLIELREMTEDTEERQCLEGAISSERFLRYRWLGRPLDGKSVNAFSEDTERLADYRWSLAAQGAYLQDSIDEISNSGDGRTSVYCYKLQGDDASSGGRSKRSRTDEGTIGSKDGDNSGNAQ